MPKETVSIVSNYQSWKHQFSMQLPWRHSKEIISAKTFQRDYWSLLQIVSRLWLFLFQTSSGVINHAQSFDVNMLSSTSCRRTGFPGTSAVLDQARADQHRQVLWKVCFVQRASKSICLPRPAAATDFSCLTGHQSRVDRNFQYVQGTWTMKSVICFIFSFVNKVCVHTGKSNAKLKKRSSPSSKFALQIPPHISNFLFPLIISTHSFFFLFFHNNFWFLLSLVLWPLALESLIVTLTEPTQICTPDPSSE